MDPSEDFEWWLGAMGTMDPDFVVFLKAHPVGGFLGGGKYKRVYFSGDQAVGLATNPRQARREVKILGQLGRLGLRVVEVREFVVREKWVGMVMELLHPPDLGDGERLTRRRCRRIARRIEEAGLFVRDLQCLADADSKIVLADPFSMRKRKPNDKPQKIRYGDWWDSVWGWDKP